MSTTWFVSRDGKQHGPITDIEFRKLIELGHLKSTDFVWHEGAPDWMPGTKFLDASTEAVEPRPAPAERASQKSPDPRPSTDASGRPGRRRAVVVVVSVVMAVFFAAMAKFAVDAVLKKLSATSRSELSPARSNLRTPATTSESVRPGTRR